MTQRVVLRKQDKVKVQKAKDTILKYEGCKLNYKTLQNLANEIEKITQGRIYYLHLWQVVFLEFGYDLHNRYGLYVYEVVNGHLKPTDYVKEVLNCSHKAVQLELPLFSPNARNTFSTFNV